MDMLAGKLQQLCLDEADAIEELMLLASRTPSATVSADTAGTMMQRYSELVQHVGQTAWDSGLDGLQSVCALVETNLLLLQSEKRALSPDEFALLEGWPMQLFGYLHNHADRESSMALLQSLSSVWPMSLPKESVDGELNRLMGVTAPAPDPDQVPAANLFAEALLDAGIQQVEREMLAILISELALMEEQFNLGFFAATDSPDDQALDDYLGFLDRLKLTVESIGLSALGALFAQLNRQLVSLRAGLSEQQQALLQQFPERLAAYLTDPIDEFAGAQLIALLADTVWPTPVALNTIPLWQGALANIEITENTRFVEARQIDATAEDVSLELPDDVNAELLEGLLQELPVQVSAFATAIEHITLGQGELKDMERAMRAAHTLKGAANTVGVPGIANLTHHLEDILVALIDAGKLPQRALAEVLINASDCLEAMNEYLLGMGPVPEQALEVLQEVLKCANRIDQQGVDWESTDVAAPDRAMQQEIQAQVELPEPRSTVSPAAAEQSLRVPASVVDELLRLSGEGLISNSQLQEHLRQSISQAEVIRKQDKLLQQLAAELEELVDIRGITSPHLAAERKVEGFDDLEFEHYGELHTISRRLIEAVTDAKELNDTANEKLNLLDELLEEQYRLQMASQHAVMRTRMVVVSNVISRLQRGVRQAGRLLDKSVDFRIKGENTSIDGNVLNDLIDPLMHILRNAVDHGIETPAERAAAGKPPQGRIELTFAREGNSIVVRCSDDGAGLNFAAIRRIAERKGMLRPEQGHTEEELARLILSPGFSTRDSASQISGRGVGMDVVYSRVQERKGTLVLNSRSGQGLTVELRLPATLLSTHTLIVRERENRLAISSRGIEDIRYVTADQIVEIGSRRFFREGENMYGLVRLEAVLPMSNDRRSRNKDAFPVLLTRMNDGAVSAIQVQEILDSREVVLKNFGRYVPRTPGVVGAVILGDGGVAPVIDLVELLNAPVQETLTAQNMEPHSGIEAQSGHNALHALVVDDSHSARRAMAQVLKDAGYSVRTANDGLEAVNILEKYIPDIILSDMEMPRMNGLELTTHVRYAERTKNIPVIMITSRSTEKHRQLSSSVGVNVHIVKPFSDDALLQHVARLTAQ